MLKPKPKLNNLCIKGKTIEREWNILRASRMKERERGRERRQQSKENYFLLSHTRNYLSPLINYNRTLFPSLHCWYYLKNFDFDWWWNFSWVFPHLSLHYHPSLDSFRSHQLNIDLYIDLSLSFFFSRE